MEKVYGTVTPLFLALMLSTSAFAQMGGGNDRLTQAGLEVGMQIPDVTLYDAAGQTFDLRERLKGSPAVLVFGCLT